MRRKVFYNLCRDSGRRATYTSPLILILSMLCAAPLLAGPKSDGKSAAGVQQVNSQSKAAYHPKSHRTDYTATKPDRRTKDPMNTLMVVALSATVVGTGVLAWVRRRDVKSRVEQMLHFESRLRELRADVERAQRALACVGVQQPDNLSGNMRDSISAEFRETYKVLDRRISDLSSRMNQQMGILTVAEPTAKLRTCSNEPPHHDGESVPAQPWSSISDLGEDLNDLRNEIRCVQQQLQHPPIGWQSPLPQSGNNYASASQLSELRHAIEAISTRVAQLEEAEREVPQSLQGSDASVARASGIHSASEPAQWRPSRDTEREGGPPLGIASHLAGEPLWLQQWSGLRGRLDELALEPPHEALQNVVRKLDPYWNVLVENWRDLRAPDEEATAWDDAWLQELDYYLYQPPPIDALQEAATPAACSILTQLRDNIEEAQQMRRQELRERFQLERIEGTEGADCWIPYVIEKDPTSAPATTDDPRRNGSYCRIEPGRGGYRCKGEVLRPTYAIYYRYDGRISTANDQAAI